MWKTRIHEDIAIYFLYLHMFVLGDFVKLMEISTDLFESKGEESGKK